MSNFSLFEELTGCIRPIVNLLLVLIVCVASLFGSYICFIVAYRFMELGTNSQRVEAQVISRYFRNTKNNKYWLVYTFEAPDPASGKKAHYTNEDNISETIYETNPRTIDIIYAVNNPYNSAIPRGMIIVITVSLCYFATSVGLLWFAGYALWDWWRGSRLNWI